MISDKNPFQIVIIKGFGSGGGAIIVAAILGKLSWNPLYIGLALGLGFISYGLSVFFYVMAQHYLGASKTSCYYALSPFIGGALSYFILKENLGWNYLVAFILMIVGVFFVYLDKYRNKEELT